MDQAGLVHRISHLLRTANANIESLETRLSPAPITGAPMFEMELLMAVPRQTPIGKLRDDLGRLCDELNIDWQLAAV
jgi:glycine cleavage system transcriptional repressor